MIYVGVFLLVFLIALHYTDDPRGRVTALASLTVLLTVIISVLAMLDRPFGVGTLVQPSEMRQALALVSEGTKPARRWHRAPRCPRSSSAERPTRSLAPMTT